MTTETKSKLKWKITMGRQGSKDKLVYLWAYSNTQAGLIAYIKNPGYDVESVERE